LITECTTHHPIVNTADLRPAEYTPMDQAEEDAKWAAIRAEKAAAEAEAAVEAEAMRAGGQVDLKGQQEASPAEAPVS